VVTVLIGGTVEVPSDKVDGVVFGGWTLVWLRRHCLWERGRCCGQLYCGERGCREFCYRILVARDRTDYVGVYMNGRV